MHHVSVCVCACAHVCVCMHACACVFTFFLIPSQDGALLTNNPTAVALHEARLLWGKSVPIQCIISLGTGRCEGVWDQVDGASPAGLKDKLIGVASGATDTEGEWPLVDKNRVVVTSVVGMYVACCYCMCTHEGYNPAAPPAVHAILKDVLPPTVYYRFNPPLPEAIPIDECKPEQINRLIQLTEEYLEAGPGVELDRAVAALLQEKTSWMLTKDKAGSMVGAVQEWIRRKAPSGM